MNGLPKSKWYMVGISRGVVVRVMELWRCSRGVGGGVAMKIGSRGLLL